MNVRYEYKETCDPLNIYQTGGLPIWSPGPEWRMVKVNIVMQEYVTYPGSTPTAPSPFRHCVWEKIHYEEEHEPETPS